MATPPRPPVKCPLLFRSMPKTCIVDPSRRRDKQKQDVSWNALGLLFSSRPILYGCAFLHMPVSVLWLDLLFSFSGGGRRYYAPKFVSGECRHATR